MGMLDKGKIQVPGRMEQDQGGARFQHITQNCVKFKTYELFVSEISHLLFSDYS